MLDKRRLYECDPDKNTVCKKTGCMYNKSAVYKLCHRTTNINFAWDGKKQRIVK